jgi:hypothetical protein
MEHIYENHYIVFETIFFTKLTTIFGDLIFERRMSMAIIKELNQCLVLNVGVVARGSRCLSISSSRSPESRPLPNPSHVINTPVKWI